MAKPTRLTIRFEDDQPSLNEHRLSVATLVESLDRLVKALRRIASGIDTDAWPSDYGHRRGRLSKKTEGVDWEISSIKGHPPLEVSGVVVHRLEGAEGMLFDLPESSDLTDAAVERLPCSCTLGRVDLAESSAAFSCAGVNP